MAWNNPFQEVANSKPLFLTIYGTVIIGILLSSFYIFSAIYSPDSTSSWRFSSSPPMDHKLNVSYLTTVSDMVAPMPQPLKNMSRPFRVGPPSGSKMPPLDDFRLTKELVQKRVKDNVIVVTFGNYAFMDFILTWVKHLQDLQVDNILVGAMDTKLLEALYWKGVPVFDMGSHMSTVDVGWGSPTFHKMGREKVILIDSILPYGFELLMCDTDMVWLKNPLPYLARYPEADVLTSSDQVVPTVVDDRLDIWQQVGAAYNIGIFHWRPTESSKKLAKEWKEMLLADDNIWDQNGFNDIVRRQLGPSVDEESGLVYAYDGNLKLGILPASIFCSGHTYFVQVKKKKSKVAKMRNVPSCLVTENDLFLPAEILCMILSWLEIKCLLRCTSVCKVWNAVLVENIQYIDMHAIHNGCRSDHIIIRRHKRVRPTLRRIDVDDGHHVDLDRNKKKSKSRYLSYISCRGLLVLGVTSRAPATMPATKYRICNPTTKRRLDLPRPHKRVIVMHVFLNSSTSSYHVVSLYTDDEDKVKFQLIDLGGQSNDPRPNEDLSWRTLNIPGYDAANIRLQNYDCRSCVLEESILFIPALRRVVSSNPMIVCVDLLQQACTTLNAPPESLRFEIHKFNFQLWRGKPALSLVSEEKLNVYMEYCGRLQETEVG